MIAYAVDDTFINLLLVGRLAMLVTGMQVNQGDTFFLGLMHFFDDLDGTDGYGWVHGLGGDHACRRKIDDEVVHSCLYVSVCKNSVFTQHIRIFNIFTDETWKKKEVNERETKKQRKNQT